MIDTEKTMEQAEKALAKAGFEVTMKDDCTLEITREGFINPADVRSNASAVLSAEGFQGYYLKEVYAYKGSRKPWRTEEEGFVEMLPWDDEFRRDNAQKKVAKLNRVQVAKGVQVTPLPTAKEGV